MASALEGNLLMITMDLIIILSTCNAEQTVTWTTATSTESSWGHHIVGAKPVDITNASYIASLQYHGRHGCGGTIISDEWILTAAHCTMRQHASKLRIRIGSANRASGGQLIQVKEIQQHSRFVYATLDYDYSLLRLNEKIIFDNTSKAIPLAEENEVLEDGTLCVTSGWGKTRNINESEFDLREAFVPIWNQTECENTYHQDSYSVTPRMICAGYAVGGKDACQGDSGGPLVCNGKLISVVSWGLGCALPNKPGVYARISAARDWIKKTAGV